MPARRPTSITVFAILNIVFGSLGLACGLCGVVGQAASGMMTTQSTGAKGQQFDTEAFKKHMEREVPGYTIVEWGRLLLGIFLSLLLLGSGIGLLKMQLWARLACMGYGVIQILVQLGVLVYNIALVLPAIDTYFRNNPLPGGITMPSWSFVAGAVVGALLSVTYAVILLIWAALPATGRAFSQGALDEGRQPEQGQDYYDEDYRRERRDLPPGDLPPES